MTAHPTAGETAAESHLRTLAYLTITLRPGELAAIDMGREALALLREIHTWRDKRVPDEVADDIETRIDALLARARGDA